ncbi:MAG: hypothetical protein ABW195_08265 [Ilumatobacteraceae bacterium]
MSITDHWHELVTVSLLGTDRRDPPEPPPGPLADVVADALATSPSERMLAAVGACVAARRAGLLPLPPVAVLAPPAPDDRPLLPVAAAARWRRIVAEWPVLEDEWLQEVERRGWQLSPDVLVGLLRRHRTDAARRARVERIGGPVVAWLGELQPDLRPVARRGAPPVDMGLPGLAVPPTLLALLEAPPGPVVTAVLTGFLDGTFVRSHRAVLVNFVARARPDGLPELAEALGRVDLPYDGIGVARSLADLATTRHEMLQELCEPSESSSERTRKRR